MAMGLKSTNIANNTEDFWQVAENKVHVINGPTFSKVIIALVLTFFFHRHVGH